MPTDKMPTETSGPTLKAAYREEAFLSSLSTVAVERAECLARYRYARPFVQGKVVCDAACGVGYGSYDLAAVAADVTGMDLNEEEIAWANRYYRKDNVRFLCADLCGDWPVETQFDVVTSFETLEHLQEPQRFLTRVHEHLKPGGRLLLSAPNGPLDLRRHPDNYHHVQHFRAEELRSLVGRFFPTVDCFSQIYRKNVRHYLAKALRGGRSTRLLGNYSFVPGFLPEAQTWLVVAVKATGVPVSDRQ